MYGKYFLSRIAKRSQHCRAFVDKGPIYFNFVAIIDPEGSVQRNVTDSSKECCVLNTGHMPGRD